MPKQTKKPAAKKSAIRVSAGQFNTQLDDTVLHHAHFRAGIQALIRFGFKQWADTKKRNSNYLAAILNHTGMKGANLAAIQTYIESHTNLKLHHAKGGKVVFKQVDDNKVAFIKPVKTWWEFSNKGSVSIIDVESMVKSMIRKLESGLASSDEKKALKKGSEAQARKVVAALKAVQPA